MTEAHASQVAVDAAGRNGFFSRVGGELRDLATSVNDLQRFLTPLVSEIVRREPAAVTRLQDLDLLAQALDGLSDLMCGLDACVSVEDEEQLASEVEKLRLSDLARRLNPDVTAARSERLEPSALDLF